MSYDLWFWEGPPGEDTLLRFEDLCRRQAEYLGVSASARPDASFRVAGFLAYLRVRWVELADQVSAYGASRQDERITHFAVSLPMTVSQAFLDELAAAAESFGLVCCDPQHFVAGTVDDNDLVPPPLTDEQLAAIDARTPREQRMDAEAFASLLERHGLNPPA